VRSYTAAIALLFITMAAFAQNDSLVSKVYSWEGSPIAARTGIALRKNIFSGAGNKLASQTMTGIILPGKKSISIKPDAASPELFYIVKKGPVNVLLLDKATRIDKGSVIVLLPGDSLLISNPGMEDVELYEMRSRAAKPDAERGKKGGSSFVLNWNDMVFKPHDKGGVRQLFDRPTTMLNRFDIHITQLNTGFKSHDPHTHSNEEIILMLDGNAEMQIGTSHQKANAGDVVYLGSMVLHNLTNVGTTPCVYFAIQWN
jgi:(S)-ureidoglycine aminohydrolase